MNDEREWESNSLKIDFHVIFALCWVILLLGMAVESVEYVFIYTNVDADTYSFCRFQTRKG